MKHKLYSHSDRVLIRQQINGQSYRDNPLGLPYNNNGELMNPGQKRNGGKSRHWK